MGDRGTHDDGVRKLLSEEMKRAAEDSAVVDPQDLARWQAAAESMERRLEAARSILEDFEPDDTYGAMIKMSVIDALEED